MTHEDRPGCRCGLCGSSALRVRLKQIRERFKVAHVEGSGAQTFARFERVWNRHRIKRAALSGALGVLLGFAVNWILTR